MKKKSSPFALLSITLKVYVKFCLYYISYYIKNFRSFINHKEKKGLPKERALWFNKHTVQAILHNNPHSAGGELAYTARAEGGKMVESECFRHSWSVNVIMMA